MKHSKWRFIYLVLVAIVFIGFSCGALDGDPEIYLIRDSEDTFHFQWNEPLVADRIILVRAAYTASAYGGSGRVILSSEEPTENIYLPDEVNTIGKIEYGTPIIEFEYETPVTSGRYYWMTTVSINSGWDPLPEIEPLLQTLEFALKPDSIGYYIELVNIPKLVYKSGEIEYLVTETGDLAILTPNDFTMVDKLAPGDVAVDYTVSVDYTANYILDDRFEDQLFLLKAGSVQSRRIFVYRHFDRPGDSGICTIMILPAEARHNFTLPAEPYDPDNQEYTQEILIGYPFQPYDVGEPSELSFNY